MSNATIETTATEKPAKAAVVLGPAQADIKSKLDGLAAIKKVKGLSDEARAATEAPLVASLTAAIEAYGEPVARGNTLYTVVAGELVVVDLTPKTLVRL